LRTRLKGTYIDFQKNIRYLCPILVKPEFSVQIFAKSSNIVFHKNPSTGGARGGAVG
jgi:hypothetical protein